MIKRILEYELIHVNDYYLTILDIVQIIAIFLIAKIVLWLIKKAISQSLEFNKLDEGTSFALFQLIKYIVWIIVVALMLDVVGVQLTILLAGSAALLVGVGLGLQQTFNDVISGIILLFEHSVKVGDILDVDGDIVIIQEIGLRTSKGINRQEIITVLPNSLITTNKVINWSHQSRKTLFKINVGVAYGSDVDLVVEILKKSAAEHEDISFDDVFDVRFLDFGNSSLDFQLLFYSEDIFGIERVKSEIRKNINRNFIKSKIIIPFPQMDLHVVSNSTNLKK